MSAFSYLCQKINISFAHNTITIYSKNNKYLSLTREQFTKFNVIPNVIRSHDPHHNYFHDDAFNRKKVHYHFQFPMQINKAMLAELLDVCIELSLISSKEKNGFLVVYETTLKTSVDEFWNGLFALEEKSCQLIQYAKADPKNICKHYSEAAETMKILYETLKAEATKYMHNKSLNTYEHFKKTCNTAIEKSKPQLEKHRGCKQVLANVIAAILGLGVIYLVAAGINYYNTGGKHFFFQFKTDSIELIEKFKVSQAALIP
jgi:hypothetical protein